MKSKWLTPTAALLSATAFGAVDFIRDVKPILEQHCLRCHSSSSRAVELGETEYVMENVRTAMIKGESKIVPGNAAKSAVYTTTVQMDPDRRQMPPAEAIEEQTSRRLNVQETEILRRWIDEGAYWPESATLVPRRPFGVRDKGPSLTDELYRRLCAFSREKSEEEMRPYSSNIIGTRVMFEMVPIPGGKFIMGSPAHESGRSADEGPQREVAVEPFWMGKHEVTWDEFHVFMFPDEDKRMRERRTLTPDQKDLSKISDQIAHPTPPYVEMSFGMGSDGFPAISMTQHAANKYCQWLSARTGHFYRLPTEAEWEYAARAGTTTAYSWGDDASQLGDHAWWGMNSDFKYQKVGTKKPNPWGLHDMLGNVAEWTLDQYDPHFYAKHSTGKSWNVATMPYPHSVRGGSWDDEKPARLRSAARAASTRQWKMQDPMLPKSRWFHTDAQTVGFRIVRPLKVPNAREMERYWYSGVEKDEMHSP